jgi:hypothetical protein
MAAKQTENRLRALTGGINTVSELNNLISFDFGGTGAGCEFVDIENYFPLNRGGQSRVGGFSLFFDTGSTLAINGLYRFIKSDGTNLLLFGQSTKVYKLVSGVKTDIGITTSAAYLTFETAMDRVVICDALAKPFTYDGSATGSLTAAPAFAKQSLFYQNRLWVITDQSPNSSYVYYSNPSDITTGYGTQFIPCGLNDGQKIVSISKFFIPGTLDPVILVCKERTKGIILGDGSDANPYYYVTVDLDAGGVSLRGVVQFGQQIAVLTPQGVNSYTPGQTNENNLNYKYLSEKVRPSFQALNQNALNSSISWYDWKNTRISFAVPETSFQTPNVIWHFDTRLGCWYKERWNLGQDCTASLIDSPSGNWYHGDSQGKIYLHDMNGSFDGQNITSFMIFPFLDFGNPRQLKRCIQAAMMVRSSTSASLGFGIKLDYGQSYAKSITLNIQNSGTTWGSGKKWGDGTKWGSTPNKYIRFYPGGPWQTMQPSINQTGIGIKTDIFEISFITESTGFF